MIIGFQLYILCNFQLKEKPNLLYHSMSFYINLLFDRLGHVVQLRQLRQLTLFLRDPPLFLYLHEGQYFHEYR